MENCEVITSSLPVFHTFILVFCGSSSVGRATAFQAVGRGFEPRLPLLVTGMLAKVTLRMLSVAVNRIYGKPDFQQSSFRHRYPSTPKLRRPGRQCRCSSVVEHFLGKEEVKSSILFNGSHEQRG